MLPVGADRTTGLPFSIQLVGRAGSDELLLQFAARLEEKAFPAPAPAGEGSEPWDPDAEKRPAYTPGEKFPRVGRRGIRS